jgi:hypothetical protein
MDDVDPVPNLVSAAMTTSRPGTPKELVSTKEQGIQVSLSSAASLLGLADSKQLSKGKIRALNLANGPSNVGLFKWRAAKVPVDKQPKVPVSRSISCQTASPVSPAA